jgi:hypothetical protein
MPVSESEKQFLMNSLFEAYGAHFGEIKYVVHTDLYFSKAPVIAMEFACLVHHTDLY